MNTKNNEERLEHWKSILESCQSRPDGQTIASRGKGLRANHVF